jgi:hypothetical protein
MADGKVDGEIIVKALVDNSQAEKELKDLEKRIDAVGKAAEKTPSNGIKQVIDDATDAAGELQKALNGAGRTRDEFGSGYNREAMDFIENYHGASQAVNEMKRALEDAKAVVKDLESQGKWFGDEEYDKATAALDRVVGDIKQYKKELNSPTQAANPFGLDTYAGKIREAELSLQALKNAGKGLGSKEFDEAYRKLALLKDEAKQYAAELSRTPDDADRLAQAAQKAREQAAALQLEKQALQAIRDNATVANEHVVAMNEELSTLQERLAQLKAAGVGPGYQEYDQVYSRIKKINDEISEYFKQDHDTGKWDKVKEKVSSVLKTVRSGISQTLKATGSMLKSLGSGIVNAAKKLNVFSRLSGSLSGKLKRLGSTIKSALVFSVIYKGLGMVKEQVGKYLSLNTAFTAAVGQVRGALLTAFQPIYDAVVPALTSLLNILARAITVVSQFTSALFGTTGKQAQANAKALNAQAKATENAGSAADKAQKSMASFDEINQLSTGGGGTADAMAPAFDAQMDDTVFSSWGAAFSAFLDSFLNNGLPRLKAGMDAFAAGVNTFAQNLLEMFTFPGVLDKVKQLGTDLGQAFNDMVNNIDWATLGAALGSGLNLAVQFLVSYIYSIDWQNLGSSLADLFNSAISSIDWIAVGQLLFAGFKIGIETLAGFLLNLDMAQLAKSASNLVIGFMDSAYDTLASIDWQQIGQQVKTFLVSVDWAGVAESTFRAIGAAFGALTAFLWGLIKDAWAEVVNWWHETAYEDGEFTLQGLLDGIWNVIKDIGTWIKDHIFQPFIDGFKNVFGIHSPSTVMAEQGKYLMDGLLGGIKKNFQPLLDAFKQIMSGITNFISGVFSGDWKKAWDGVKDIFAGIWNGIVSLLEGAINAIIDGLNWLISQMNKISFDVPNWVPLIGGKSMGISIPSISRVEIPRLAQGAVIPPNREFMAVLGDQKQGTNIEAPLETIKQALAEVMAQYGNRGTDQEAVMEVDGVQFAKLVFRLNKSEQRRIGVSLTEV